MTGERLVRTASLLGEDGMAALARARVLIVGVGGVGGWCAEALARTGIGHLTLVDDDVVVESNLNRQCAATVETLGCVKVEAMRARLLSVNPVCDVVALKRRYPDDAIRLGDFDIVVDAIDSVECKAMLIENATAAGVPIVSSMGAALRIDPARVKATRFVRVAGDGLARALRRRFKQDGGVPGDFTAVWSDEPPKASAMRGSIMPVVATFGMCLATEVMNYVRRMQS